MSILPKAGLRSGPVALLLIAGGCISHSAVVLKNAPPAPPMERQIVNALDAGDGDYEAKLLRASLDRDPLDLKARLELARYYQRAGFPEIAIEHCRLACERAPESVEAHLALAKMLRADGKISEAAAELAEFAVKHDAEVEVWAWLGWLRDESGDWISGEAAHRKAVALAPGRDDLRNNLGYCLLKQGRKDEAAAEFRAALKINAQSTTARNNLGLAVSGNAKEAVLNWQSVSDAASAHNNMAVALIESGQYAEARHEIEIALSYNQQHSAALKNLSLISQLDGKAAAIAVPVRAGNRLARMRASWVRFWGGSAEDTHVKEDSGSSVASR
jgi:Flp pilus assembly protein TadD